MEKINNSTYTYSYTLGHVINLIFHMYLLLFQVILDIRKY